MHLGNGAITPECAALTYGAAAAGLGLAAATLRTAKPTVEKLQLAAGLGCAVFAAQAINVPIAPGISGHFVGGVLLAWALGPALGAWTMALVLVAQALVLGDGDLAALGANILNMALLPAGLVAAGKRFETIKRRHLVWQFELGAAALLAVILAAALIIGETALFRPAAELSAWSSFAARMLAYHAWIGLLEGCATIAVVTMIHMAAVGRRWLTFPQMFGLAAVAILIGMFAPLSSSLPDGYEAAAERSGVKWLIEK